MHLTRPAKLIIAVNAVAIVGLGLWDSAAATGWVEAMPAKLSVAFALLNYPSWYVAIRGGSLVAGYSVLGYVAVKHLIWAALAIPQWVIYVLLLRPFIRPLRQEAS